MNNNFILYKNYKSLPAISTNLFLIIVDYFDQKYYSQNRRDIEHRFRSNFLSALNEARTMKNLIETDSQWLVCFDFWIWTTMLYFEPNITNRHHRFLRMLHCALNFYDIILSLIFSHSIVDALTMTLNWIAMAYQLHSIREERSI